MAVTWYSLGGAAAPGRRKRQSRSWGARLAVIGALLVAAELITRANLTLLPTSEFTPPSQIIDGLYQQVQTRLLWDAVWGTFEGWALATLLATAVAIPVGLALGMSKAAYRTTSVTIDVLRPLPTIALLPLLLLLLHVGTALKVYIVAWAALWPLLLQTIYGVWDVDPV